MGKQNNNGKSTRWRHLFFAIWKPLLSNTVASARRLETGHIRTTSMLIRKLTEEDLDALWDIRLRALQDNPEAFGSTYEETRQRGKESFRQRLRQPHTETFFLGAFDEESLVGIVAFHREGGQKGQHKGYIISMYVAPEQRGRGIGKALLSEAIAQARTVPGLEQLLLAVATTQTAARQLYRSLGFEVYGLEPRALKQGDQYWDEELMILRLQ
jgi:ribosomal protein S18 acetylase RimI-like enzyme